MQVWTSRGGLVLVPGNKWQDRGNGLKLQKGRFRLDVRGHFFMEGVIKYWRRLPMALVKSSSLEVLKN